MKIRRFRLKGKRENLIIMENDPAKDPKEETNSIKKNDEKKWKESY